MNHSIGPQKMRLSGRAILTAVVTLMSLSLFYSTARGGDSWLMDRGDLAATGAIEQTLPQELEELWRFEAGDAVEGSVIVLNQSVIVATVDGQLHSVTLQDGRAEWKQETEAGFLASPTADSKMVVIGDLDGVVRAYDVAKGDLLWTHETDGEINAGAALVDELVLVTSQDGSLYGLDRKSGERRWTYTTGDQIRCRPTVVGGRTFLGGCDGSLHSIRVSDGTKAAEPMPLDGPTGSTPAVVGQMAVLPTHGGSVLAFDWEAGKQLWSYSDPERGQEYRTSAAMTKDIVVVASQNRQVFALDPKDGHALWSTPLRRRSDSSPVIAGDDVWIAATDGRLYRLGLVDGKEKWQYEIKGGFLASPAIAQGRLIVATDAGTVICFGGKEPD